MEKIPEMSGVLGGNCFQTCSYIPQKNIYRWADQGEVFNKTGAF